MLSSTVNGTNFYSDVYKDEMILELNHMAIQMMKNQKNTAILRQLVSSLHDSFIRYCSRWLCY